MKTIALLFLLCASLPAIAQVQDTNAYLQRMDSNGDGRVSPDEYLQWMLYAFDKMDRNGDGVLSAGEMPAGVRLRTATTLESRQRALTRELEALRGGDGFSGRAPGGPSRWSTERSAAWEPLRPERVVEVGFDQVSDDRFRHGTKLLRFRPDKAPAQCRMEQLES